MGGWIIFWACISFAGGWLFAAGSLAYTERHAAPPAQPAPIPPKGIEEVKAQLLALQENPDLLDEIAEQLAAGLPAPPVPEVKRIEPRFLDTKDVHPGKLPGCNVVGCNMSGKWRAVMVDGQTARYCHLHFQLWKDEGKVRLAVRMYLKGEEPQ